MFPTHDQCCLQLSVNFHSDQNLRNEGIYRTGTSSCLGVCSTLRISDRKFVRELFFFFFQFFIESLSENVPCISEATHFMHQLFCLNSYNHRIWFPIMLVEIRKLLWLPAGICAWCLFFVSHVIASTVKRIMFHWSKTTRSWGCHAHHWATLTQFWTRPNRKHLQTTIKLCVHWLSLSLIGWKTLWLQAFFSFSQNVFKRCFPSVSMMVMWESSQWLWKNIVQITG